MSTARGWDPFRDEGAIEIEDDFDPVAAGLAVAESEEFDPVSAGLAAPAAPRLEEFLGRVQQDPELSDVQRTAIERAGREAFDGAARQEWSALQRIQKNARDAWTEHTVAGAGTRRASLGQREAARGQMVEARLQALQREADRRAGRLGDVMADPTLGELPDEVLAAEQQRLSGRAELLEARRQRTRYEGLVGEALRLGTYEGMPDAEGVVENAAALTGQLAGGIASPENLVPVPGGAGAGLLRRMAIQGAAAAGASLATEPLVQGARQEALQQDAGFDWGQAGEGALFAFAAGGLLEAAPSLAQRLFRRLRRRPPGAEAADLNRIVAEELAAAPEAERLTYQQLIERNLGIGREVKPAADSAVTISQEFPPVVNPARESAEAIVRALELRDTTGPRGDYTRWWEDALQEQEALAQSPQGARRLASELVGEQMDAEQAARLAQRAPAPAGELPEILRGEAPADPRLVDPTRRDPLGARMMPPPEIDVGQGGTVRPAWSLPEIASEIVLPPRRNVRESVPLARPATSAAAAPAPSRPATPEGQLGGAIAAFVKEATQIEMKLEPAPVVRGPGGRELPPAARAIMEGRPVGDETPVERIRSNFPDADETLDPDAVGGANNPIVVPKREARRMPGVSTVAPGRGGRSSQAMGILPPGAAQALDNARALRNRFSPQSALPRAMRDVLRFGEQEVRGILSQAQAVQRDLRSALRSVGDMAAQQAEAAAVQGYLTGRLPLAGLVPSVRDAAQRARALVDGLSDRAVREGVVQGELAQKFTDNLGSYLRRSYRIFADAEYRPEPKLVTAAIDAVAKNLGGAREEAARLVNDLVAKHQRAAAGDFLAGRGKLAGKDVSSLVARKDLLPEIRALLGEIDDPLENLGQTVPRLARLIELHHAQRTMKDLGLKLGVFRDTAAQPLTDLEVQSGQWVPLVGKESATHEAWRGLHARPEVADAIQRGAASGRWEGLRGAVWEAWRGVSALSKISKTVLNPDSFAPNFLGGLVMGAANGNFRLDRLGRGLLLGAEETGALRWLQERGLMAANRQGLQQEVARLTALGLRGEGLGAADLAQNIERSVLKRLGSAAERAAVERVGSRAVDTVKGVASAPFVIYRGSDDLTKYVAWKSEMARYARAFPSMVPEELERYAAEVVRATMPTYSEVPKFLREASQLGLSPTFVNFTWEVFRNTANAIRVGTRDLRMGAATGNRQLIRAGAERLAALTAAVGLASAAGLSRWSREEQGVSSAQDEAVRTLGAPWNRNSSLLYTSEVGADGKVQFANLSYLLPHAVLFEAATEAARAQTSDEPLTIFARALGGQFLGIENSVVLSAITAAVTGRDAADRRVINPESPTVLRDRVGLFIDRALRPAFLDKLKRISLAYRGELSETGRAYSLTEEAKRLAAVRAQTLDAPQAVRFRARELGDRWRNASALYRGKLRLNLPAAEIEQHYQRSEDARKRVFDDMQRTYRAARALNVPEDAAIDALRGGGLPSDLVLAIIDGGAYVPGEREQKESVAEIFARIRQQPLEARKAELRRLALEDPALLRRVAERQQEESRGVNARDRLVRSLGVSDGERAAYIRRRLDAMPTVEERRQFLRRLKTTGALTDRVVEQVQQTPAKRD